MSDWPILIFDVVLSLQCSGEITSHWSDFSPFTCALFPLRLWYEHLSAPQAARYIRGGMEDAC
jgi:hypothetical protein